VSATTTTPAAVVRRYFEEMANGHNLDLADELFSPDFGAAGAHHGPDVARAALEGMWAAFPDLHFTIDDLVAQGDRVVVKVTYAGTHRGSFLGIEPTGRRVSFGGVEEAIVRDGRIAREAWHIVDRLQIREQLGAEPRDRQP
jgi:predicted ester cyclase